MDIWNMTLKEGWRFHRGDCEDAWYKGFDDSGWRIVAVPHDWSVESPFSRRNSSGTGYLDGGTGWYRVRFVLPEEMRGKNVRLTFDGVYKNSQVWCNSYYLGKRPNGYTTFSYDISDRVNFGGEDNEISVKVTHTDIADSRWFTGSGITRKVTVTVQEPVHPAEFGCFFRTEALRESRRGSDASGGAACLADVSVLQEAVNDSAEKVRLSIETELWDPDGRKAAVLSGALTLEAGASGSVLLKGAVEAPRLWSTEEANLYRMRTYYRTEPLADQAEGQELRAADTVHEGVSEQATSGQEAGGRYLADEAPVGIRLARFDADKGFFLNGKETKLKGVCVHHDGGCLGAAMTAEVWRRRLEVLKGCGCNAIRCSHNPHMPELYELCDAMGLLVMDEAFDEWENAKNKWANGHNVYPPRHQGYFEDFPQWYDADLRAMVRRDRNHPSVVLWSIGNEIDYPNDPYVHPMFETMTGNNDADKPAAERQYDRNKPNAERLAFLAGKLAAVVRQEDTTRPVTLAAAFPELSSRLGFLDPLDAVGYNYKEELYEEDHKRFPDKPFYGSETGHTYRAWRIVKDRPYISGQFLWTGVDYLGEAHGWPVHGSPAGLLDCAGFPKPEFYRRKSFWTEGVMVHLATCPKSDVPLKWQPMSHSWNYPDGEPVTVKCYTDPEALPAGAAVVLECNGKQIGRAAAEDMAAYEKEGAFCFTTEYEPGTLRAMVLGADGEVLASHELRTAGAAAQAVCSVWQDPADQDGRLSSQTGYLYQILLQLTDRDGLAEMWDDRTVRVQVLGDGELAGLENGNLADVTPYCEPYRKTWQGRLAAYVRRTGKGEVKVLLTADGLGDGKEVLLTL